MITVQGYSLANLVENELTDTGYYTYDVTLLRNGVPIAQVHNPGDTGVTVNLLSRFKSIRKNEFDVLLYDFKKLIKVLGGIVAKNALCKQFASTPHMSALGFVEILIDLNAMHMQYEEGLSKLNPEDNKFLAIYSTGGTLFSSTKSNYHTKHLYLNTKAVTEKTAIKRVLQKVAKTQDVSGNLTALLLTKSDLDWNFTFDQYRDLLSVGDYKLEE